MRAKSPINEKELLTSKDLQDLFSVKRSTIFRWQRDGVLPPAVKIGTTVRWRAEDIREMIKKHTLKK